MLRTPIGLAVLNDAQKVLKDLDECQRIHPDLAFSLEENGSLRDMINGHLENDVIQRMPRCFRITWLEPDSVQAPSFENTFAFAARHGMLQIDENIQS